MTPRNILKNIGTALWGIPALTAYIVAHGVGLIVWAATEGYTDGRS